jgi:hypothetical protein
MEHEAPRMNWETVVELAERLRAQAMRGELPADAAKLVLAVVRFNEQLIGEHVPRRAEHDASH